MNNRHDVPPRIIGDWKDADEVGPFLPEGEEPNIMAMLFVEDFLEEGKWDKSKSRCHVHCHICEREISNMEFLGYGLFICRGYMHYVQDHRVVLDKDLQTLAVKFFKGQI